MERVKKTELARRLGERVALADDLTPKKGLEILIYGWMNYRKFGQKYRHAIHSRDYLFATEIRDLSDYAGCDLRKSQQDDQRIDE